MNIIVIMVSLTPIYRIGILFSSIFLIVYHQEIVQFIKYVFMFGLVFFGYSLYKGISYLKFLSRLIDHIQLSVPSLSFEYPQKKKTYTTKPIKKSVGNATFDTIDIIAQCFQIKYK